MLWRRNYWKHCFHKVLQVETLDIPPSPCFIYQWNVRSLFSRILRGGWGWGKGFRRDKLAFRHHHASEHTFTVFTNIFSLQTYNRVNREQCLYFLTWISTMNRRSVVKRKNNCGELPTEMPFFRVSREQKCPFWGLRSKKSLKKWLPGMSRLSCCCANLKLANEGFRNIFKIYPKPIF